MSPREALAARSVCGQPSPGGTIPCSRAPHPEHPNGHVWVHPSVAEYEPTSEEHS